MEIRQPLLDSEEGSSVPTAGEVRRHERGLERTLDEIGFGMFIFRGQIGPPLNNYGFCTGAYQWRLLVRLGPSSSQFLLMPFFAGALRSRMDVR